jgi:hypothetical protein
VTNNGICRFFLLNQRVTLERADLDAAYAVVEAALQEIGGAVAAEDNFPPIGAHFADRAVIACPG